MTHLSRARRFGEILRNFVRPRSENVNVVADLAA
jgi:hypothetical protein